MAEESQTPEINEADVRLAEAAPDPPLWPGRNLTAEVTEGLIRLFGVDRRFGLVGVHTSSGAEGTN